MAILTFSTNHAKPNYMIPLAANNGPNLACGLISLKLSSSNSNVMLMPSSSNLSPSPPAPGGI
eukprot:CAMPEP_0196208600 /NCGR_PEP_ID=MMETSP0912-20130531/9141_1 /TAXON_ID=49265 /ORGANISM="Thalassiosira rotula, Strain GSO102" /LENGTH=62 /DNA_ID=CAMNT_0041483419 /DNA_START=243 /DNA_END=431 /DNA_ORIENTATION=-